MRFFLLLIIFCLFTPLSFPKSQGYIANLYGSYLKGLLYIENGEYEKGVGELEKVKDRDPQSIQVRVKLATALIRLEKTDEAIVLLKEAKEIDPQNLDVSLALIFVYSYLRDDAQLEEEYEHFLKKAHELKPKDIGISEYLAQFYFYKKNPQEAIKIYEKILQTNPDYISALFWLGYLYDDVGQRQAAIRTWKKGLEIDSSYAPILNSLGYIYAQEGVKLNEAEAMLKKALQKEPDNGAYLDSLGWIYFKKGDYKKAEKYLTEAISYVKDPEIYEHLGDFFVKMGDLDKGIGYYQEGLSHFPEDKNLKSRIKKYEQEGKIPKK